MPNLLLLRLSYWLKNVKKWNWALWIQWILVNTLCWAIADWTIDTLYDVAWNTISAVFQPIGRPAAIALFGAMFGVIVGGAQEYVLRRQKARIAGWWVFTTALSCALIWVIPWPGVSLIEKALSGLLVGIFQWRVLRRKYRESYWWIAASSISWALGEAVSRWVVQNYVPSVFSGYKMIMGMVIYGLVYGIISGLILLFLSQQAMPALRLTTRSGKGVIAENKWVFGAFWIILCALGWMIGFGSAGQMIRDKLVEATGMASNVILDKAMFECLGAICLWFILWQQRFRGSLLWIILSSAGGATGILAWNVLELKHAEGIILYGAIVGFFQWFVLSQRLQGFFLWMCVRTLSWSGSLVVVSSIGKRINIDVGWAAGGFVYGVITGALLLWRLRRRLPHNYGTTKNYFKKRS